MTRSFVVALVFIQILFVPVIGFTQVPEDEDRPRPDRPSQAAAYRALLVGGQLRAEIPADALSKATIKVNELRSAVATRFGARPTTMMLDGPQGIERTIGGIPVGPLHGEAKLYNGDTRVVPRPLALNAATSINPAGWKWLGPGNIGGRTRSVLIHPTQPQNIWLGGVGGGVWKTADGGTTWAPLYDLMANVAISCMALDPNDPDRIYAGTGEGFYNADSIRGFGIFTSENGGATWSQLSGTANEDFRFVNRIVIAATSPTTTAMLVATRKGLFRSSDGGVTFVAVSSLSGEILDVRFNRSDANKAVAGARNGKAYYSTDAGITWQSATGIAGISGFDGRIELAYATANGNVVYASVDSGQGILYRSTDGGKTYTLRSSPGHLAGQGWYANCVWAGDPSNPNLVVVGGLDLHRSTNGGSTFTKISQWQSSPTSAHADHHVIIEHPTYNGTNNKTVFFGNDGGLYRADDVTSVSELSGWQELNNGLGITQFYGAAVHPPTGRIVAGAQDNGTLYLTPTGSTETWFEVFGGDGGDSAFDPVSQIHYGEYVYLQIHRGQAGGGSNYIYSGIADAGSNALFIAPFILDPNNSARMLAGGARLWRSNNVKDNPPSWKAIKPAGDLISAIAVAPGNSKVIWVGTMNGTVQYSSDGTASSPSWATVAGLPSRYCSRITFDPNDSTHKTIYVTFTGYSNKNLQKTTDGGTTWSNLGDAVLPEIPFYDIVVHPSNTKILYLGTELGLFVSDDAGVTWSPTNQGPTNAPVSRLFWVNTTLYVATHGRGIFNINLATPDTKAPRQVAAIAP